METKKILTDKVLFNIAIELSNSDEYKVYSKQNNFSSSTLSISDTLEEFVEKGIKSKELKHLLKIMKSVVPEYEDEHDLIQKYGVLRGAIKIKLPKIDTKDTEVMEEIPLIFKEDKQNNEDTDIASTVLDGAMTITTYAAYILTVRKLTKEDIEIIEKIEEVLSKG